MREIDSSRLEQVMRLFAHYLNRLPSDGALRDYVEDTSMSLVEVENAIKHSQERKNNIKKWYRQYLGRSKDPTDDQIHAWLNSTKSYVQHRDSFLSQGERERRLIVPGLNKVFEDYSYSDSLVEAAQYADIVAPKYRDQIDRVVQFVNGEEEQNLRIKVAADGTLSGNGLHEGLLVGFGHYTFLSNPGDKAKAIDIMAEYGANVLRVFSSLPRNPEQLPDPWWIDPFDTAEYDYVMGQTLEACQANNMRLLYCYFDEVTRTDDTGLGRNKNTWRGKDPSADAAKEMIDYYMQFVDDDYFHLFLPELMNEPPGEENTWNSEWNASLMQHVRLHTNVNPISIDYENPIGNAILWEHAHPAYQSGDARLYKEGAQEILATMRRWRDRYRDRGAAVHVGLSTDGTREWKIWDVKELAKMCVGEGFSIELMMASREASRWNSTDRRIAEDFAKGAGLI